MNILVINGSPNKENGNTHLLVEQFVRGAESSGATCEILYTRNLIIKHCSGCYNCWKKTPGNCVYDDDMKKVIARIRESDLIVYATPLYHSGMTSELKKLIERTLPVLRPYIINKNNQYGHPMRYDDIPNKYIVISNCGFPERDHFKPLMNTFNAITGNQIIGSILCTAGEFLNTPFKPHLSWYLDAVYDAGKQIVEHGFIDDETNEVLEKELIDLDTYLKCANEHWQLDGEIAPTVEEAKRGIISSIN